MGFPKFSWLGTKLLLVLLIPALAYVLLCQSILKSHLKTVVTNEPEVSLGRSLSTLRLTLEQQSQKLTLRATALSQNERLRKALTPPTAKFPKLKTLGQELSVSLQTPLFVLLDKKGNVLYDSLNLPLPTLVPTPSPVPAKTSKNKKSKSTHKKSSDPLLFSAIDWPGVNQALKGSPTEGTFTYQDKLYQATLVPIRSQGKTVGALLIGFSLDEDFFKAFKKTVQNDLVYYSHHKVQFSTFPPNANLPLERLFLASSHGSAIFSDQNYVWDEISLKDLNQIPAGTIAVFQPLKQSLTLEGNPRKEIIKWGVLFLALLIFLGFGLWLDFAAPLRRIVIAVVKISDGDLNAPLPVNRLDEWGSLARALAGMVESLKEKDRVSLILGKVLSPQAAKKILAEKDYFALKGERRDCTILYADLRGFNILSENMTPPVLVEALNQYFSLINEIVFKYEGMLDKFIGETAVAIWGAPFTPEDKEERAVKTALEIQEALKEFNISRIKKGFPPFTIGIGIHTGPVVSGNLGSEKHYDYTVIGEPLHIASRLCAMAAPGQTVVTEETYEKVKTLVKANLLNPIAVKGSMQPLGTYEITQLI
ncbi:MAG TPA: adenylate/guanylate cyclase domain-containing protein [bacterium]